MPKCRASEEEEGGIAAAEILYYSLPVEFAKQRRNYANFIFALPLSLPLLLLSDGRTDLRGGKWKQRPSAAMGMHGCGTIMKGGSLASMEFCCCNVQ